MALASISSIIPSLNAPLIDVSKLFKALATSSILSFKSFTWGLQSVGKIPLSNLIPHIYILAPESNEPASNLGFTPPVDVFCPESKVNATLVHSSGRFCPRSMLWHFNKLPFDILHVNVPTPSPFTYALYVYSVFGLSVTFEGNIPKNRVSLLRTVRSSYFIDCSIQLVELPRYCISLNSLVLGTKFSPPTCNSVTSVIFWSVIMSNTLVSVQTHFTINISVLFEVKSDKVNEPLFLPEYTLISLNEPPLLVDIYHLLGVAFWQVAVTVIVAGLKVIPPSLERITCEFAVRLISFAESPASPCLEHDQLNTLLNVFPSIVIGIVNFPPSIVNAVFDETAKLTLLDVFVTVIPPPLLIVPIVKSVLCVEPLYTIISV